jgi:hypothetical protein
MTGKGSEFRRRALALLLSLLAHALLLGLVFGGDGLGIPGLGSSSQERRVLVPSLRVVLLPSRAKVAPSPVDAVAVPSPRASFGPRVTGAPEPAPHLAAPQSRNETEAKAPEAKPATQAEPTPGTMADVAAARAPLQPDEPDAVSPEPMPTTASGRGEPSVRAAPMVPAAPWVPPAVAAVAPSASSPQQSALVPDDADPVAREAQREEAAHPEAARAAAVRVDVERQEAARREVDRLEAQREEAARQEAARAEAVRTEAEREQAARLEAQLEEAARVEAAARLEAEREETARREAARQDAERQATARVEAQRQDAAHQEAARVEAARLEAEREETARREAARQEAERQAAARLEAQRQDAARQEAARAEAARLDAERQAQAERQALAERQAQAERQAEAERQAQAERQATAEREAARREAVLRAIGRQLDEEADRRDAAAKAAAQPSPLPYSLSTARRVRLWGHTHAIAELGQYAQAWASRIHLNTPHGTVREIASRPHRPPTVTVAVRSDGSVESVTFDVSSGVPQVDEAIRRIVEDQRPYTPFPPNLAREVDVIEIRRTWFFDVAVRLH